MIFSRLHASDDEHIERIRRSMATFDRFRRPLMIFYVVLTFAVIGVSVACVMLLESLNRSLGNQTRGIGPGFILGMMLGIGFGVLALKCGHGLGAILFGYRNERLMIHYYDVYREGSKKRR